MRTQFVTLTRRESREKGRDEREFQQKDGREIIVGEREREREERERREAVDMRGERREAVDMRGERQQI